MFSYLKKYFKSNRSTYLIGGVTTASSIEILHNYVIKKDLQSVLRPLNLMQNLFLCGKYAIRDNIITYNSYIYNFTRVFCILIFRCVLLNEWVNYIIEDCLKAWGSNSTFYSCVLVLDYVMLLSRDLVITVSNIMHSHNNIMIVLNIQHMFKVLKINSNEFRCSVICNWVWIVGLNILYIGCTASFYFVFNLDAIDIISIYACINFEVCII